MSPEAETSLRRARESSESLERNMTSSWREGVVAGILFGAIYGYLFGVHTERSDHEPKVEATAELCDHGT